jgi:hypothetical protein
MNQSRDNKHFILAMQKLLRIRQIDPSIECRQLADSSYSAPSPIAVIRQNAILLLR